MNPDRCIPEAPPPAKDLDAFRRAKAQVDMALELRRQARAVEEPDDQAANEPLDAGRVDERTHQ